MNRLDARSPDGTPVAVWVDGNGPPIAGTGEPVAVSGRSYGANCAMGGAALTRSVAQLVLHEPSVGTSCPSGALNAIEATIAAGDLDAAAVAVLSPIRMSDAEIEELRASERPDWSTRIDSARTLAAGTVPGARIRALDDHGHTAHKTGPILVADLTRTFVSTEVLA